MKKLIIPLLLSVCLSHYVNGQWAKDMIIARQMVDSLNAELKNAKGAERVDCFNLLSSCYFWIWDDNDKHLDTACLFANRAYIEAKRIKYKRGLGYGALHMAQCANDRVDVDTDNNSEQNYLLSEKYAQESLKIGEEIKDYRLAGDVYNLLKGLAIAKGDRPKFKTYVLKAIFYYEKPVTNPLRGLLNIATCKQCQGNEILLGHQYKNLAEIVTSENNGNPIAAKEQIEKAIYYYTLSGRKGQLGRLYYSLSNAYFRISDYEASEEASIKAISYYKETGDSEGEIMLMNEMCKVYEVSGDFEKGLYYGKKSIQMADVLNSNRKVNDISLRSSGQAFFWMCRLYKIAGDYETALSIIRRGRDFYPNPIDSIANGLWSAEIGDVHRLLGNLDSALFYLKPFEKTANQNNNFGKISLGFLYTDLKQYDKALQLIAPFTTFLRAQKRFLVPAANCLMITGKALLGEKKYKEALQNAREAQIHLDKLNGRVMMISNYKLLSEIFFKLNLNDSAYHYLNNYTNLKDSLLNRQLYWRLNDYKKEAEEAKKEARLGFLDRDNKIKEQQLKQNASLKKFLILGLALFLVAGVFIFRYLTSKRKNEKLLREQAEQEWKMKHLESEKKQIELQRQAAELEMQALRAQMNPHFIFNCLSSINRFILKNESKAASNYLTRFSRLMRMVLMNSQKPLIALDEELEMVGLYLEMERLRFKNTFDYTITFLNAIDSDNVFIPPLLLQPFCENAIWHGLMHKEGQGKLDIELSMQDNILNCSITDNGIGREKAEQLKSKTAEKEKSMGLKITTERLALLNHEKGLHTFYEIQDMNDDIGNAAGTKVILKISTKESIAEAV